MRHYCNLIRSDLSITNLDCHPVLGCKVRLDTCYFIIQAGDPLITQGQTGQMTCNFTIALRSNMVQKKCRLQQYVCILTAYWYQLISLMCIAGIIVYQHQQSPTMSLSFTGPLFRNQLPPGRLNEIPLTSIPRMTVVSI